MTVQVFVGFGGSGGKALAKLAELIADDAELSDRGDRDFYFLLVDTDIDMIEEAERDIRAGFKRINGANPCIESIRLASGVGRLQDLVHARLGDIVAKGLKGREPEALKEAKRHWYFRDGTPFSARRLPAPLTEGAGQCPLAAHFAAWDKVPAMRATLDRIRVEMQRRLHELNDELQVDLVVVGSLAGGTGRGCWQLLSLVARSVFPNCKPHAYLFDASVFAKTARINPDQAWRMQVNSYTGLSEIVGWIRNDHSQMPMRFALPPLDGLDSGQYCIDTDKIARSDEAYRTGRTPADNFYIITGASDSHTILSADEAYQLVAIALLARLAIPAVSSAHANGLHYGSCGAAIARVPVTAIHECIVACARELALEQILAADGASAQLASDLFCDKIQFSVKDAARGGQGSGKDTLIYEYRSGMLERMDRKSVSKRFKESKPTDAVLKEIEGMELLSPRRTDVQASLAAAVATRFGQPAGGTVDEILRAQLERCLTKFFESGGTAKGEGGAPMEIGTAVEFLAAIGRCASELKARASKIYANAKNGNRDLAADMRAELEKAESRRYVVFGERWQKHEVEHLDRLMDALSLEANSLVLAESLIAFVDTLIRLVDEYAGALKPFVGAVQEHEGACQQRFTDLYNRTFMHGNLAAISREMGSWRSGTRAVSRQLKPIDRIDEVRQFVSEQVLASGGGAAFGRQRASMIDEVRRVLFDADARASVSGSAGLRDAAQRKYKDDALPEFLTKISVPAEAMERRYNLWKTVESIEQRVRGLLEENIGDVVGCEQLQDAFEAIFGVRHDRALGPGNREELRFSILPTRFLVQELAFVVASQCDPMVQLDRREITGRHADDRVTVFVPFTGGTDDRKQFEEEARTVATDRYKRKSGGEIADRWLRRFVRAEIKEYEVEAGGGLAYTIVAHSHFTIPDFEVKSFDGITSFQTWRSDAVVREWLQRCESPNADSVFLETDGNFGVGYIHPDFLKAPWCEEHTDGQPPSGHRWAPWRESPALRRQSSAALDAIIYALCGNLPSRESEYAKQAAAVLQAIANVEPSEGSGYKWSMPLLHRQANGSWKLARRCFGRASGLIQAVHGDWEAGKEFSTLQQFIKWIGGSDLQQLTRDGQNFVAAVGGERDLVREHVVSKIEDENGHTRRKSVTVSLAAFLDEYAKTYLPRRTEEQHLKEEPLVANMSKRLDSGGFDWEAPSAGA
jgi:hypothetical protein